MHSKVKDAQDMLVRKSQLAIEIPGVCCNFSPFDAPKTGPSHNFLVRCKNPAIVAQKLPKPIHQVKAQTSNFSYCNCLRMSSSTASSSSCMASIPGKCHHKESQVGYFKLLPPDQECISSCSTVFEIPYLRLHE